MIKNIIIKNFKSVTKRTEVPLEKFTAFLGPNGCGKSTRLQAVAIACQGYLSDEFGKQARRTMDFASGDEMLVGVDVGDHRYERAFIKSGDSAKQEIYIDGEKTPVREGDGKIKAAMGDFPLMFDLDALMKLTPAKRREFLFRYGNLSQFRDKDQLFGLIIYKFNQNMYDDNRADGLLKFGYKAESIDELDDSKSDEYFAKLYDEMDDVEKEELALLLEAFEERYSPDPQVFYGVMLDMLKAEISDLRQQAMDADATKRKLAEIETSISDGRARKSGVAEEIERLEAKRDELVEAKHNNEKAKIKHQQRAEAIEKTKADIAEMESFLTEQPDIEKMSADVDEAVAEAEKIGETHSRNFQALAAMKRSYKEKSEVLDGLAREVSALEAVLNGVNDISKSGKCVLNDVIPCKTDFGDSVNDLSEKLAELNGKLVPLKQEAIAMGEEIAELDKTTEASRLAKAKAEETASELRNELKRLTERLRFVNSNLEPKVKSLSELERMPLPNTVEDIVYDSQLTEVKQELTEKRDLLVELERAEATVEALHDTVLKGAGIQQKKSVAEAMRAAVTAMRDEMLEKITRPLTDNINTLLRKIDKRFMVRFDMETGNIYVGRGKQEVVFDVLSGGEQVLVSVALLVSLVDMADPPQKVLTLECGEVSGRYFTQMLEALPLIADSVDNVLVAKAVDRVSDSDKSYDQRIKIITGVSGWKYYTW